MYRIVMITRDVTVDMPNSDRKLPFYEACHRSNLYKERNRNAMFLVVSNINGEIRHVV